MIVEESIPNEQLRRARSVRGWTQTELAEEIGTCFEMVSRWERGITIPGPYFRERLCTALSKSAEELGLAQEHASLPTPLPTPLVFLASSHADVGKALVSRLKMVLQERGITLWDSRQLNRHAGEHPRALLREVIHACQAILVIGSPQARTSRHVKAALEMASIYQRPVCSLWIEGEHWQECLPPEYAPALADIDARGRDDLALCEEIITTLEDERFATCTPPVVARTEIEAPVSMSELRDPCQGLQAFLQGNQGDFIGHEALLHELLATLNTHLSSTPTRQKAQQPAVVGPSVLRMSRIAPAGFPPHQQASGLTIVVLVETEEGNQCARQWSSP